MSRSLRNSFRVGGTLAFLFSLVALMGGCITKSAAKAQAQAAYQAGQNQALLQMQQQQQQQRANGTMQTPQQQLGSNPATPAQQEQAPSVTVVGQVKKPVVPWTQELTVARAILASEYYAQAMPASIVLKRFGQEIRIDPKRLLNGEDFALQPGDILEIRQ